MGGKSTTAVLYTFSGWQQTGNCLHICSVNLNLSGCFTLLFPHKPRLDRVKQWLRLSKLSQRVLTNCHRSIKVGEDIHTRSQRINTWSNHILRTEKEVKAHWRQRSDWWEFEKNNFIDRGWWRRCCCCIFACTLPGLRTTWNMMTMMQWVTTIKIN